MVDSLKRQLEKIEEFVLVEDKIVTYKLVSKTLKVHTNTAKQLLFAFSNVPGKCKLLTTYLIGGLINQRKGIKFKLVTAEALEEVKKDFNEVTTEHVYSVQRLTNITGADLYNADTSYEFNKEDQKFSSIHGNEDIKTRKHPNLSCAIPKDVKLNNKSLIKKEENRIEEKELESKTKIDPLENKEKEQSKKSPSQVKSGLPKKSSPKKNDKKNSSAKKGYGIGAFFNKQTDNAVKQEDFKEKYDDESKENKKNNIDFKETKTNIDNDILKIESKTVEDDESIEEKEIKKDRDSNKKKKNNVAGSEIKKKENTKKRKQSKDQNESRNKRRKRIVVASDLESSEGEMDYEEVAPPSPECEPAPVLLPDSDDEIIPATPVEKGKRRVRKQIDRTFADDDGFIVTKKEYIYESCSDEEVESESSKHSEEQKPKAEPSAKEETKSKSPKLLNSKQEKSKKIKAKPNSPQKNKQASITSFFMRK